MSRMSYKVEPCEARGQHWGEWIIRWIDQDRGLSGGDEICRHFRTRRDAAAGLAEILREREVWEGGTHE